MRACLWLVVLAASSAMTAAAETTNLVEILRRFQAELDLHDGRTPAAVRVEIPPDTQTAMKPQGSAAPRESRLRTGDWVRVQIENEPGMSTDRTEVAQDGTIRLPIVGPVRVAGTTVAEATQTVRQLLERDYLVDPRVVIERLSSGPGHQAAPEVRDASPNVATASPAERATSTPVAPPSDRSNPVDPPPQKRAEALPSPALPPPAATKVDTLESPTAPPETELTEETDTPALVKATAPPQLEDSGMTPSEETVLPDAPTTVTEVDTLEPPPAPVAAVSTEQDPDSAAVESVAPATAEEDPAEPTLYLVLTNQVAKPGKYPWTGEGMTLRIALETAGGPTAQADMGRVLVRRLIRGEPRQLEVNLEHPGEAWRSGALLLKPGDVVEVPVRK